MRRMSRAFPAVLIGLVLSGKQGTPAVHASVEQGATCGQAGLPPCPLQSFMRNDVAAPLARGDMKAISGALRRVATFAPPAWASWSSIALAGASAADKGDRTALRAACNDCHRTWREEYRQRYRARPLP